MAITGTKPFFSKGLNIQDSFTKQSFEEQATYGRKTIEKFMKESEMNHDPEALETKYRKIANDYGAAYVKGDHKAANKNYDKLAALLPKLRATSDRGKEILRRLMKDESDAVATWAATHSLPIAENDALVTLCHHRAKGRHHWFQR